MLLNSEYVYNVDACTRSVTKIKHFVSSNTCSNVKKEQMEVNDVDGHEVKRMNVIDEYRTMQQHDVRLAVCWRDLKLDKSDYVIRECNKLLYRKVVMNGEVRLQLVVLLEKRAEVMHLAHDTLWSGHFGKVKTQLRVDVTCCTRV